MTPRAGVILDGRWELTRRIAVGGMGEVWAATEVHTGREVAAKVLRPEFAGERLFLDRIAAEARNSADLDHPGIARTYAHGEVGGLGYLVMQLVEGEPLSAVLARERTLSPRAVLDVVAQTAQALAVAHRAQVVHRDIKPANLLIGPDGAITLTDFGISLGANQAPMTAAGMVMGTAQYLPPEQAMGRPATGAGDLYALGIIAYEALVGHRPFTGTTQVDIAFAHVTEPLPPLPGRFDLPLRSLVEQMLAKDPADRPASADEVAARARALLADLDSAWDPTLVTGRWRSPSQAVPDGERPVVPVAAPARALGPAARAPHAAVPAAQAVRAVRNPSATRRDRHARRPWHPAFPQGTLGRVGLAVAVVLVVAALTLGLLMLGSLGQSARAADPWSVG
ncbi:serine/threonine-protein kinase [Miniimonas sp. S16]|uniref:serine/threonine-protein kinase n=1 Tax=Miniimonas sp. S16 TaxID=2171623 RepID=UPI000D529C5F|nr:serine/threonine-protein kinase [Miniimonas sp. S16]